MSNPIQNPPPDPNQSQIQPPQPPSQPSTAQAGGSASSRSALEKWLGPQATPDDVTKFLNNFVKFFAVMIKQSDEAAQKANQELKKVFQDNG
jgi:hypothetical protein